MTQEQHDKPGSEEAELAAHNALPGLPPLDGLKDVIHLPLDHKEAWDLACYKHAVSNMARCYIALSHAARSRTAPELGTLDQETSDWIRQVDRLISAQPAASINRQDGMGHWIAAAIGKLSVARRLLSAPVSAIGNTPEPDPLMAELPGLGGRDALRKD